MRQRPKNIKKNDWDNVKSPSLSDDILARMEPVHKKHPQIPRRVRGQQKSPTKVPVSIRLSPDVVSFFKSKGEGWQSKIDKILGEYVKSH
ncbi:MAG: BrnA antitoxin family protein [Calditrichaceae bacterium]|nr:BrnA antitoxin family protein [Calditrichaceae bacterium]MBN2708627.1 BrnA antitoxin family protein [Calditrichaceae bacterium]RQV95477.1 MAG: hypothetical protein EH224_07605 [Calditrichota bacterium]